MPHLAGLLLACCLGLAGADIQLEMDVVVPTALNETQFASDVLDIARNLTRNRTYESSAPFALPAVQILDGSPILCLLGIFCFEAGQYTYLQTPTPTPSPGAPLDAGAVAGIAAASAAALAGVGLLYLCRRPRRRGKVVIRATIDWPPRAEPPAWQGDNKRARRG